MIQVDNKVDAKGLACPMPIVQTKKVVKEMKSGGIVEIEATDKGSTADLKAWAISAGHEYICTVEEDGVLKHYLRKANDTVQEVGKFSHVVSNEQLKAVIEENKDILLLDVREVEEYALGHIPTAQSMPLDTVVDRMNEINQESEIYVICRSGNRSDTVAKRLVAAGYEKVFNVKPGMSEWNGALAKINREA